MRGLAVGRVLGDLLPWRLVRACEHAAQHDVRRARRQRFYRIAGRTNPAISDDWPVDLLAVDDCGQLRHAKAGLDARRTHRARPNAHLDHVRPRCSQVVGSGVSSDVASDDADVVAVLFTQAAHRLIDHLAVAVRNVDADNLGPGANQGLGTLHTVA